MVPFACDWPQRNTEMEEPNVVLILGRKPSNLTNWDLKIFCLHSMKFHGRSLALKALEIENLMFCSSPLVRINKILVCTLN